MILVLIGPRDAGLPVGEWLREESGRLVAVTATGTSTGTGFADVISVDDYTDDVAVLGTARALAAKYPVRAVFALGEMNVARAAVLRAEFGLPGLLPESARAYRDKVVMKEYATKAGIRVPAFAPVETTADIAAFMAAHPGRVVLKPRLGSGATGVRVLDEPTRIGDVTDPGHDGEHTGLTAQFGSGGPAALGEAVRDAPHEVEEFVPGAVHHVDAFRVDDKPVFAVASAYLGDGCLAHWTDSAMGSYTLDPADPTAVALTEALWRLTHALPTPPTVFLHAEFFVTPDGDIVLCEVAARVGGGQIPLLLKHVLGDDPRKVWARVECGLPVDLDELRARALTAPRVASCGVPPRLGRVVKLPQQPQGVSDFTLSTHVGDDWHGERYQRRKSADFLASWAVIGTADADVRQRLLQTAALVSAGFGWSTDTAQEGNR